MNRTSTETARLCMWAEATGRVEIVLRAEIAAGAAVGRAAVGVIEDAAGAVGGLVAADAIVAGAADRAGEDTKIFRHGFARIDTDREKGHDFGCGLFSLGWAMASLCLTGR